jgi:hypothetical protein
MKNIEGINYDNSEEVMKLIVEEGSLPQFFYHYTTFDTGIKILESGQIRFSKPSKLNDPFDCQATIDTTNSDKEIELYVNGLIKEGKLQETKKEEFRNKIKESDFTLTNDAVQKAKEEFGIACFSKRHDSLLMWAHYADKHNGIVLKFDIFRDTDFFMIPFPICYKSEYPQFNYIRDCYLAEKGAIGKFLLETKFLDWQYEEEIRIMKRGADDYPINKKAIVEIIFGCRMSDENKSKLIKIAVDNNWDNLKFICASKKTWMFGLDFSEYIEKTE